MTCREVGRGFTQKPPSPFWGRPGPKGTHSIPEAKMQSAPHPDKTVGSGGEWPHW